ncbi:MAG: hypothetical protein AAFY48_13085 [Bacteroidota bacterium]
MLITLLTSLNLAGQTSTTPEQFFAQVKAGESAQVQFDKSVSILFLEERVPNTFYYETLKRNGDWFFLSYSEQYEKANQLLCQCELEELQLYFSIMERPYLADDMWGILPRIP